MIAQFPGGYYRFAVNNRGLLMARMRIRRAFVASIRLGLIYLACLCVSPAAHSADSADETYLNALQGHWEMVGAVGKKPVRYRADGHRVLQGGFLNLHMIDTGSPAEYEADLFIGFDRKAHDYIAHWLDRFGAAGARVVAQGTRTGERLVITFPYADGPLRDTFTWQPATKSWSLLLESQASNGTWSTFASYTLTHRDH
jgi:hypothetical protein